MPAEWEVFIDFLLQDGEFARMSPVGLPPVKPSDWCDLFVDGTCAHPAEPKLRYGAWAVTARRLANHLVLGGHVQDLCQSAFRAELTAATRCMKVRLWCDCQGVVSGEAEQSSFRFVAAACRGGGRE